MPLAQNFTKWFTSARAVSRQARALPTRKLWPISLRTKNCRCEKPCSSNQRRGYSHIRKIGQSFSRWTTALRKNTEWNLRWSWSLCFTSSKSRAGNSYFLMVFYRILHLWSLRMGCDGACGIYGRDQLEFGSISILHDQERGVRSSFV